MSATVDCLLEITNACEMGPGNQWKAPVNYIGLSLVDPANAWTMELLCIHNAGILIMYFLHFKLYKLF